ncbi:antibiotic biosynthesis monooxygenase family protein [Alcaligenes endophyticus]|uniref:Antibiotic biosynthesis monooxygenase n=1 Tax=Alcaligenes endophyticus TaxID=1929088 RepID=A0ABT8EF83_9BURK|nr:antibiotic biosynthesis monooxygenase [Alcaligenes endophyticus]MCX5590400.1 antibiotic biosynthesis monooxygenase [Alcaligenes endophyticus]MDN4119936.1 antibiotic biosynthesis monooxygenase [Alcaligenes endophyticus]
MNVEEIVDIRISAGQQQAFEEAVHRGVTTVIGQAKGFMGYSLQHSIESPERYLLTICWKTLEDHTVGFRESELFPQWRAIVGPFFAQPPVIEHFVRA